MLLSIILVLSELSVVDMANGLPDHSTVLKVGFLNHKVEELLPKYRAVYDVIITNDGTFDFVLNSILDKISASSL